jgi:GNAT superfamily N-acetyltransferase
MTEKYTDPRALSLAETAEIVETTEADMFRATFEQLPPAFLAEYGASWQEVGGATAIFFEKLPVIAFNRVVGLGCYRPATPVMIDEFIALYTASKLSFAISLSPAAQPAQLVDWLLERGFQQSSNWAKMIRGTAAPTPIETELSVEQIDKSTVGQYAAVAQTGFGMPEWTVTMFAHMAEIPGVYSYIAYAGDEPAGVGSLLISGDRGALFNGATLPEFRRRGVQGAIMARRIQDGIARGCRWLTTETSEDTPESPNPSYRNMVRTGFHLAYLRPNFVYKFE